MTGTHTTTMAGHTWVGTTNRQANSASHRQTPGTVRMIARSTNPLSTNGTVPRKDSPRLTFLSIALMV